MGSRWQDVEKVCKKCVPNDLVDKLCINNKRISLKSSKILAVWSAGLQLSTLNLVKAFRIKSDKQTRQMFCSACFHRSFVVFAFSTRSPCKWPKQSTVWQDFDNFITFKMNWCETLNRSRARTCPDKKRYWRSHEQISTHLIYTQLSWLLPLLIHAKYIFII